MDTSEVTAGHPDPQMRLVHDPRHRVTWSNPGAHSAIKLWGQDAVLITDEVYGDLVTPIAGGTHGCPWGWVRTIDIADETEPALLAEYKLEENDPAFCDDPIGANPPRTLSTSYSAHNPTVTPNLALVTWHSAGFEIFTVTDPERMEPAARFKPAPLPAVVTEDPALSYGLDKVVMWSFPVVKDGLIYVIDLRNGLYILRYTGEHAEEIDEIAFLEGNSNLGDALRFEPVADERMAELAAGGDWVRTASTGGPASPSPAGSPGGDRKAEALPWLTALVFLGITVARFRPRRSG